MNALRTILSKNKGALSPDHFAVIEGLKISGERGVDLLPREKPPLWSARIPYHPRDIHALLTMGYDVPVALDFQMSGKRALIKFYQGTRQAYFGEIDYIFDGDEPYAYMSKINLAEDMRGKGMGKNFIRNLIEFDIAMGGRALRFMAGYDNGGYSWARMGAQFNMDPYYAQSRKEASEIVIGRLNIAAPYLAPEIYRAASKLAAFKGQNDAANIAKDFSHVMIDLSLAPPFLEYKDLLHFPDQGLIQRIYTHYKPIEASPVKHIQRVVLEANTIRHAFEWASAQGQPGLSLPRLLLTRTVWPATVDYKNKKRMNDIGNYLGGWKTIGPTQGQPDLNCMIFSMPD